MITDCIVMVLSSFVLSEIILIDDCLTLLAEQLEIDNNRDGQEHVSLKDNASRRYAIGLMDADSYSVLSRG